MEKAYQTLLIETEKLDAVLRRLPKHLGEQNTYVISEIAEMSTTIDNLTTRVQSIIDSKLFEMITCRGEIYYDVEADKIKEISLSDIAHDFYAGPQPPPADIFTRVLKEYSELSFESGLGSGWSQEILEMRFVDLCALKNAAFNHSPGAQVHWINYQNSVCGLAACRGWDQILNRDILSHPSVKSANDSIHAVWDEKAERKEEFDNVSSFVKHVNCLNYGFMNAILGPQSTTHKRTIDFVRAEFALFHAKLYILFEKWGFEDYPNPVKRSVEVKDLILTMQGITLNELLLVNQKGFL